MNWVQIFTLPDYQMCQTAHHSMSYTTCCMLYIHTVDLALLAIPVVNHKMYSPGYIHSLNIFQARFTTGITPTSFRSLFYYYIWGVKYLSRLSSKLNVSLCRSRSTLLVTVFCWILLSVTLSHSDLEKKEQQLIIMLAFDSITMYYCRVTV